MSISSDELALPDAESATIREAIEVVMERIVQELPETLTVELGGSIVTAHLGHDNLGRACYLVTDPIVLDFNGQPVRISSATLDQSVNIEGITLGGVDADLDFCMSAEEVLTEDYDEAEPHITHAMATLHMLFRVRISFGILKSHPGPADLTYSDIVKSPSRSLTSLAMLVSPEFAALADEQYNAALALAPEWTHAPSQLAESVRIAAS